MQVRDVFEEAWSEAEHYVFYSHKDDVRETTKDDDNKIQDAKDLINSFRGIVDQTRQHITKVKQKVDQIRPRTPDVEIASATPRADDNVEIAKTLKGRVAQAVLDNLADAYRLLHEAEVAKTNDEMRLKFTNAAIKFQSLRTGLGSLRDVPVVNRGNMPIGYFVDIELANSYVFSDQPERGAIKLYRDLLDAYPKDPTIRYRYARAIMLQNPSGAEERERAYDLIKNIPQLVAADPLTQASHWLPMGAAILAGYIHYERVKDAIEHTTPENIATVRTELENAVNATLAAVSFWDKLPKQTGNSAPYNDLAYKAMSNIVYYLAHLIRKR